VDEPAEFDRDKAREVLDVILQQRGMSWEQYRLGTERSAYLRRICEADLQITEEQLRQEFEVAYGERVRIRHIQISQPASATRIRRELNAGIDFAELVPKFNANPATAAAGGMLKPFSAGDPLVPQALREAAFRLPVGEVSTPIQVENWHHFIRVEERLAADSITFEQAQADLRRRVTDRMVNQQLQILAQELYRQARIRVIDPVVRDEYEKAHPEKGRR
jgi:parvulin-like peptidyl-prolyl isomerase